jgi:hypothetical protein
MAKKKKDEEIKDTNKGPLPEDKPEAPEPAEEKGEDSGSSKGEVVVKYRDHRGETVERTFSKKDHGSDFKKLADEFKATNAARIVA